MKANLILSAQLFILFTIITPRVIAQEHDGNAKLNLLVSNVCEYIGQVVVCNGPDSSVKLPSYGSAGCMGYSSYQHYDSLQGMSTVQHVEWDNTGMMTMYPRLFFIGDDETIRALYTTIPASGCDPVIVPRDSLIVDSIAGFRMVSNKLVVIRNTASSFNLIVYDTTTYDTLLIQNLNFKPLLLDVNNSQAAIVGIDSSNDIILNVIELSSGLLVEYALYGPEAQNPISLKIEPLKVHLISQPGDTAIYLSSYNISTNAVATYNIYSGSGAHAFAWDWNLFYYQPETDPSGNNLELNVIEYNISNLQQSAIYNINKRLYKLIFAAYIGGYYPYMHAVEESLLDNKVYIYNSYNYSLVDSFVTADRVDFIESDLRCFVGVEEYDDSLVKLAAFPNPAGNNITIKASGLICGKEYKMDLIDLGGKVWHRQLIHAKMTLEIPLGSLSSGIYFLRIHTKTGYVTEKIIKQ